LKQGVLISGAAATGNLVLGNLIGISVAAGNPALPNGLDGVTIIGAKNNRVGGAAPGEANVLSGNGRAGVLLANTGTSGNLVQGNFIGLDRAGSAHPNLVGVWVAAGATGNTIGGTAGNFISGNNSVGVAITGAAGNTLSNNGIGVSLDGASARPN